MASCFTYDAEWTFKVLGETNLIVFQDWFQHMNDFKKDFELRRNMLGLAAILKCPEGAIPPLVAGKVGEILRQLTLLCQKDHTERLKTLEENRDFVKRGGKEEESDDDEALDDEDEVGDDDSGEDSVEEWKKSKKLLEKYGPKLHNG